MTEALLNHPTTEDLHALTLGQLTEAELAPVLAHLGDCLPCGLRLDQLAAADPLLAGLQQRAARREGVLVSPAQRRLAIRALRQSHESASASRLRDSKASTVSESAEGSAAKTHRD